MSTIRTEPDDLLYRRIYERLRTSIQDGRLKAGERLPSARAYALENGVARGTIDAAYAMLAGDGFIRTIPRVGTVVVGAPASLGSPTSSPGTAAATRHPAAGLLQPLTPGVPALDLFPRKLWAQLMGRCVRSLGPSDLLYSDPAGHRSLRQAIARHVGVSRGIACSSDEIVITAGFQSGLALAASELASPGDAVWVEDPGYSMTSVTIAQLGLRGVGVPVDPEGISVDHGLAVAPAATLCVVTTAHQFPLGIPMSRARRRELLSWASDNGAWIIEDDFDGEFRAEGRSLPPLKAIDDGGRVIYAGTFSKTLFPALRLGYLIAPRELAGRLRRTLRARGDGRSIVEQSVVAEMLVSGHFARHVQRMRLAHAARRAKMVAELVKNLPPSATIEQAEGGLHLVLRIPGAAATIAAFHPNGEQGLGSLAMATLTERADLQDALLVGFANVAERHAPRLAWRLTQAITGKAS